MQNLLLLHGAIGAKDQLEQLRQTMSDLYTTHTLNFNGHGGAPFREDDFSIAGFADDILQYLDKEKISSAYIFGYSMGGYAALQLAKLHPGRIRGIVTMATKFHWDPETAIKESAMLDPEKIEEKLPAFADTLAARHAPNDWKDLLQRTAVMLKSMGDHNPLQEEDYTGISTPCQLMLGDRDKMVSLEETLAVYKKLPQSGLCLLPQTGHPIEKADPERLVFEIRKFISGVESAPNK